ncbi:MAG: hypothetical protein KC421_17690 [Anaerolineales bacterium]|nr:hypothetical protein [Anaerolineales bacterium]
MSSNRDSYRISENMAKTTWLHFEDATGISKLRLFAGQYTPGQGTRLTLNHYVDVKDIRPVLMDLSWNRPVDFKDFKGTTNDDGVQSKVLSVNTKKEENKVYWRLSIGPGKKTKTGAILPDGRSTKSINYVMTIDLARKVALELLEFLQAVQSVNQYKRVLGHVQESEVQDELFEDMPDPPPAEPSAPPQPVRPRPKAPRSTRPKPRQTPGPVLSRTPQTFANGDECPKDLVGDHQSYIHVVGRQAPSRQNLMGWIYR